MLPCKLLVTNTWLLPIIDCTGFECPQVYFRINVKNNIIKFKTVGSPGLRSCFMFANLKPGWQPGGPVASHQACVASCRHSSHVSAGRQQVSNTRTQLLPPSSDQRQDGPFPIQCEPWEDLSWTWWLDAGRGWRRAACRAAVSAKNRFRCCLPAVRCSSSAAAHEKTSFSRTAAKHNPEVTLKAS